MASVLKCPECASKKLVKNGIVASGRKRKQRYLCNVCLRTTVNPRGGAK